MSQEDIYNNEMLTYTQSKLEKQTNRIKGYEKNLTGYKEEKQHLEQLLEHNQKKVNELQGVIEELENKTQYFQSLQKDRDNLEVDGIRLLSLGGDFSGIPKGIMNTKAREEPRQRFSSITEEACNLKDLIELTDKVTLLEEQLEEKDNLLKTYQKDSMDAQIQTLQEQNQNMQSTIQELQTQLDDSVKKSRKSENEDMEVDAKSPLKIPQEGTHSNPEGLESVKIQELEEKIYQLEKQHEEELKELKFYYSDQSLHQTDKDLTSLKSQLQSLENSLSVQEREKASLTKKLEKARNLNEKKSFKEKEEIQKLEKALDIERQTVERLTKENENLKQNLIEIEQPTMKVNCVEPLRNENDNLVTEISELKSLNNDLTFKLNQLRIENSRLRQTNNKENSKC